MRSGRALMFPIYWQMYERKHLKARPSSTSILWRDLIINCGKDLKRSLDYIEIRTDIDHTRLAYCGYSSGAVWGPVFMAVDERCRTAVFLIGGLVNEPYPSEVDPLNFASHVHIPVLMLNGRYDFTYPPQTCQLPLFRLLGVRESDKRHVLLDTAHFLPRNPMIKEVLDWLDRYLGPVHTTG